MKDFKTISEIEILHEAQYNLLGEMIGALNNLLDIDTRNQCNYDYFKFRAMQYEELSARVLELETKEEEEAQW